MCVVHLGEGIILVSDVCCVNWVLAEIFRVINEFCDAIKCDLPSPQPPLAKSRPNNHQGHTNYHDQRHYHDDCDHDNDDRDQDHLINKHI